MSDAALGHDRNRDSFLDAADHGGIRHTRDTARGADIRGNSFQRHDGTGSGLLSNLRLLGGCNVHDNAALEHLGKLAVQCRAVFLFFCHMSVLPVDFFLRRTLHIILTIKKSFRLDIFRKVRFG